MKTKIIIALFLLLGFWFLKSNANSADKAASVDHMAQWETYRNEKYGYEVRYPKGWNMIEAKPRVGYKTENATNILIGGEMQKVTFGDYRNAYGVGEFMIHVKPNPDKLSLEQWVKKTYAEQYESGDIQGTSDTTIDGHAAKRLSIFGYDREQIGISILYKGYIYGISFAGDNPNDTDVKRHQQIYQQMLSSFNFIQ